MSLTEYNALGFDGKASLLNKYGKYLDSRVSGNGTRVLIYNLFGFYVEVSFRFDRKVQYIRAIKNIFETKTWMDSVKVLHLN